MIITNRKNLPQALVAACQNDPYDPGTADISITRLLAPPRQVALMKQHAHELTEDVADRIWALRSQGIHAVLERATDPDPLRTELVTARKALERLSTIGGPGIDLRNFFAAIGEIDMLLDRYTEAAGANEIAEVRWERQCLNWRVSGKLDLVSLADGCLTDWKDTSVWSIKDALDPKTEGKKEWEQQVNLLAYFGLHNGYQIKSVQVVAFGRDWRKNERLRFGDDYPDAEVTVIPLPLWDQEKAQAFLGQRVAAHQLAQARLSTMGEANGGLPECTPEERWEQPTVYAVHKVGNKTAIRLYPDRGVRDSVLSAEAMTKDYCDEQAPLSARQLAEKHVRSQPGLEVRVRPGKSPRCQQYCSALPWCGQGQRIVAAAGDSNG